MPLPKYDGFMLPILKYYGDKLSHKNNELSPFLIKEFNVSNEELPTKTKSGNSKFDTAINFNRYILYKAKCLEQESRGVYTITNRGISILEEGYENLSEKLLLNLYPELLDDKYWHYKLKGKNKLVQN